MRLTMTEIVEDGAWRIFSKYKGWTEIRRDFNHDRTWELTDPVEIVRVIRSLYRPQIRDLGYGEIYITTETDKVSFILYTKEPKMKEEIRLLLDQGARAAFDTVELLSDYEVEKDYHNISPFVRVRFYYSPDDYESWLECFETDKEEWGEGHITDREWAKSLQYARAIYYMSYQLNYPVQVICTAVLEVLVGDTWVDLESACIGGFDLYAYPNEEGLIYPIPIKEITHDYREEMVEAAVKNSQNKITKILEDQEKLTEALKELLHDQP